MTCIPQGEEPLSETAETRLPGQTFLALRRSLGLTQTEAAAAIQKKTMRPCALRTVQAWEAIPDLGSARPCPPWALLVLQAMKDKQRPKR